MKGRTAIITGAAGGIGKALARRFAAEGCRLTLVDIREDALSDMSKTLAAEYGTESLLCAGDLQEEAFLQRIVQATVDAWGRVDFLVNNAAWRTIETLRTISRDNWQKTLDVCLTAPAFLSRLSAEVMQRTGTGGVIINISSMMADRPAGNSPAYIAAKAGLEGLTRELSVTYGRNSVRALCVKPGYIDTDMSRDYVRPSDEENITDKLAGYLVEATPLKGPGSPEDVAEAVCWLCSPQASFITGTSLTIDGGFTTNMNSYRMKKLHFPNEY
jgi:NAD(P)-dependent dehydrogenase (short-subunit alcohol dehydrogenase family)